MYAADSSGSTSSTRRLAAALPPLVVVLLTFGAAVSAAQGATSQGAERLITAAPASHPGPHARHARRPRRSRAALRSPTIRTHPANPTNATDATFAFASRVKRVRFLCSLDRARFARCSSPVRLSGLREALHTFAVKVRSRWGLTSAPRAFRWRVDTTPPPAPAVVSHPDDPTNATSALFTFADSEPGVGYRCQINTGPMTHCTNPQPFGGPLSEGPQVVVVKARDAAGNDSAPASFGWTVDLTPPSAPRLTSHPVDPTRSTAATFTFSGDPGDRLSCRLDGGAFSACASPQSYSGIGEGRHSFTVRAQDAAGNESAASFGWTIDLTPPATTITERPRDPVNETSATFAFASEPGAGFACRIDGGSFSACTTPTSYTGLAEGPHIFAVRATDLAGNEGPPSSYAWTIDLTPPAAPPTLGQHPEDPTNSTSATFTFSHDEPGVGFRCALDGSPRTACSSPHDYTGLAEGTRVFSVTAVDRAGNEGPPRSFTWRIDTTPPPAPTFWPFPAQSFPENPTDSTTGIFSFRDGEPGVTFRCRLDGGQWLWCVDPHAYYGLSVGEHRFDVIARDTAGNWSAPLVHRWLIDRTPPPAPGLDLGVYRGPGNVNGIEEFSRWLRRPVSRVLAFFQFATWADIDSAAHIVAPFAGTNYRVVYSVPMLPLSGATLEEGAAGLFNFHYAMLGQMLMNYGQTNAVIRLGWEFNGDWYPWMARRNPPAFVAYWRQIVNTMRAVPGSHFTFEWSPNFGRPESPAETAYPGDAFVDYIGMSIFDQDWYPGWENAITRWRNLINLPYGLMWLHDFAIAHSKPLVCPEWGLVIRDDGHGGGDNSYFVQQMYRWFNANHAAYAIYFEFDSPDGRHRLMSGQFPLAAATFRSFFSYQP